MATDSIRGTQSISRAARLLRELASRGESGWRLTDLAARVGMDKGTTHRMLRALVNERLAQQRADTRRYGPGPLLFELGLSLPSLDALRELVQAPLARVARQGRGVAFFHLRSGDEFVCLARVGGAGERVLTIRPGTRRPLAASAGGAAILTALPTAEAGAILVRNLARVADAGRKRAEGIRRMIRRSRDGIGVNLEDVVDGVHAFGVCVRDAAGVPFASIALSTLAALNAEDHTDQIIAILARQARGIEREIRRLAAGHGDGTSILDGDETEP